jgi:hypothetical protein
VSPIRLYTYSELAEFAEAFAHGYLPLLILVGSAGLGKSTAIRDATGGKARFNQGQVSAFGLYREFYRNRNLPIVIDDVDKLYADPDAVRLLKLACQTEPEKVLEWNTANHQLKAEEIPIQFMTASPVCIVANEFRTLNPNTLAIADRGITVEFCPSATEVHEQVATWFDDQDVLNFIENHLSSITAPSQRIYVLGSTLKAGRLPWQKVLTESLTIDPRVVALREVFTSGLYGTRKERIIAWRRVTGGDRATFYRLLNQHPEIATLRPYKGASRRKPPGQLLGAKA